MLRYSIFFAIASASCPYEHSLVSGPSGETFDLIVLSQRNVGGGVVHCSAVWPNEDPHLSLFPMPPGCMYINVGPEARPKGSVAMSTDSVKSIYWVPETEYPDFKISSFPVKCDRVVSRTNYELKTAILGKNCYYSGTATNCGRPKQLDKTYCDTLEGEGADFQGFELDEVHGGQHRELLGTVPQQNGVEGFLWLPMYFFADPDELDRKGGSNKSVSTHINIENPVAISPPQIVQVRSFPVQIHSRVNRPINTTSHTKVQIPKPIWTADRGTCTYIDLVDVLGIPMEHRPKFGNGAVMKIHKKGTRKYATTYIPTGNTDDLFQAVVITATSAIIGALAIIAAATRKP